MMVPTPDDLGLLASLIADGRSDSGRRFSDLGPQARMDVLKLAYAGITADFIDDLRVAVEDLPTQLNIGIAETIAEHAENFKKVRDNLHDIDISLSHVASWFEKSKLYYP
jgi:hypothetical protein